MPVSDWDEGDDQKASAEGRRLTDWDCPECNANNPSDEVVVPRGIELRCNYCGLEFKVTVTDDGRFKFKEL